ncbi:MAG: HAMP domain-containing histidine kinase [Elusimicrobia bacterium]|nr:HAMP domain-containing histidine kinase [Elusimicrobiota bacterium]
MNLASRFAIAIGGLTIFLLTGYSGALLWAERQHLIQETGKAHWITAEHLALACNDALLSRDELGLIDFMNRLKAETSFREASCVDPRGHLIMHTDLAKRGKRSSWIPVSPEKEWIQGPKGKGAWEYRVPILDQGKWVATARMVYDGDRILRDLRQTLKSTAHRFAWLAGVALALAIGLSLLAARTLTRPIHSLAVGVRQIGAGARDTRVSEKAPGELRGLAKEFNAMALQLRDLDAMKERILYSISHDLRNPLSAISTAAKVLRAGNPAGDDVTLVESIERAALRLRVMVNNILDVAQLREGNLPFRKAVFSVVPMVEELARLYTPLAEEAAKSFSVSFPEGIPFLEADEEKTLRIFLNLIANAFKFTRRGETITLSAVPLGTGWVEFCVKDTGHGIDPERLSRLFDPVRTQNTGPQEGSGMGLSIVKSLVEGHGGRLRVETTLGKGTALFFTLPTAKGNA